MRLKENNDNWRASNVVRKQAEAPQQPHYKSKKDTKRWCKGKVGVKHEYDLVKAERHEGFVYTVVGRNDVGERRSPDSLWIEFRCVHCRKELVDHWYKR